MPTEWGMENPQVKGAHNDMPTMEEAQMTGEANRLIENDLSKVKITHKVEMKTGKSFTEWEISVKHEDPMKAKKAAVLIDADLRRQYGN